MDLRDSYRVFNANTKNTQIHILLSSTVDLLHSGAPAATQTVKNTEKLKPFHIYCPAIVQ